MKIWKGVITHPKPHDDEIKQLFFLLKYGDNIFPGIAEVIRNHKVLFLREDQFEMSPEEYAEAGWLLIGVGGGELDEHATAHNGGRKVGECGATLLARKLGIDKLPELKKILEYTLSADLNTYRRPLLPEIQTLSKVHRDLFKKLLSEIAELRGVDPDTTVKLLHKKYPDDPWVAIDWDLLAIEAKFAEQYEFHVVAPQVAKNAITEMVGEKKLATVESDCSVIAMYLRSKIGGNADVIIQKSPTKGHVQIFTNNQIKIDRFALAKLFRLLEHKAQKRTGEITKAELIREGTIEAVPEWCYFEKAGSLLNGSQTAPHTPATKIPITVIMMAVRFVLLRSRGDKELKDFVDRFRVK